MNEHKAFYVTTPIYYVNDVPHLGHAYTTVLADTLARAYRRRGVPTWFATGTDEHGQKIDRAAADQGVKPIELADRVVERFAELWERLGISHDDFIRTTQPRHQQVVQRIWRELQAAGDIYLDTYDGWYCVGCEAYYTDQEMDDDRRCPACDRDVEYREEPSYFFRLSRYQDRLLAYYDAHPEFVRPRSRMNEVRSFVAGGLQDLSVSRTQIRWGVPVPDDPDHVIYVWLDALFNYMSVLEPDDPSNERYRTFWPPALHLIGKDILRFHAVYWPAFLMSAGYDLPETVLAHGWWTVEGRKMSKSLRNVVDPHFLLNEYDRDVVRYFLLREVPIGSDGDFSHRSLIDRINADLANDLGNLLSRTTGMIRRYTEGRIPVPGAEPGPAEADLAQARTTAEERVAAGVAHYQPGEALEGIWSLIGAANRYVDRRAPWQSHKDGDEAAVRTTLYRAADALFRVAVLLDPFMPDTAKRILACLGTPLASGWRLDDPEVEAGLSPGTAVQSGEPLFPRIDAESAAARLQRIADLVDLPDSPGAADDAADAGAELVGIDAVEKLDLRVGTIVAAEPVPKADRLLRLEVDLGESASRQLVAGIAESYRPESLPGRRVMVVANLKPAKLRGVESQGMVLAAESADGRLLLIEPSAEASPGARVR